MSLHHSPHMEVRGKLSGVVSIFSFYCVGPRDQTQVAFLFGKCFYPLTVSLALAQGFEFIGVCGISTLYSWEVGLFAWVGGWVDGFSFEM